MATADAASPLRLPSLRPAAALDPPVPDAQAAAAAAMGGAVPLRLAAQGALIDSRQRWRDLAGLAADLAFETDAEGRFSFLAPDKVLGWPSAALLGERPQDRGLLLRPDPDPFALDAPARDVRAWLRRADGEAVCLAFTVVPLLGVAGGGAGLRGCARDVTAEIAEGALQAEALRRALALEGLVRRVREVVLAPRMLPVLLDMLPTAIGCTGAAVVEVPAGEAGDAAAAVEPLLIGPRGADQSPILLQDPAALVRLRAGSTGGTPLFARGAAGEILALVPQPAAAGPRGAREVLAVWRAPGGRPFDADERHLLQAMSDLLGVVLGNRRLLSELKWQARTDPLTGLLNRRAFLEDLRRRIAQAQREQGGGALLFLDVDNLKPVNDRFGHEAGDTLLVAVARLLREASRPTDLVARLGGDEFALWLDGAMQEEVAAARAAALCAAAGALVPLGPPGREECLVRPGLSLGCAVARFDRDGAAMETAESVLARADAAMYAAKHAGRGTWRLAAPPPSGPPPQGPGLAGAPR